MVRSGGLFVVRLQQGLIVINGVAAVIENAPPFVLQVLELAAAEGPAEDPQDREHEHGGQRYQEVEDVHRRFQRAARAALSTTASELSAMPRPAAQGGSQPAIASGMLAAL